MADRIAQRTALRQSALARQLSEGAAALLCKSLLVAMLEKSLDGAMLPRDAQTRSGG